MNRNKRINILGTPYVILYQNEGENPKLIENNGFCEQYSKRIVIDDGSSTKGDPLTVENYEEFEKKVLRHELIHAFLGESGLRSNSEWAENEEMVDYFAIQFEKIAIAMIKTNCLSLDRLLKEAGTDGSYDGSQPLLRPAT